MTRLLKRAFRGTLSTIVLALLAQASTAQAPADRFQQVVQPYVDAQMFMGSVLAAKDGKAVFSKSYGMADLEWSVPNSPTTRFNIASMTKQFTAASILLLEDRGKLKTDDLVKKYLPDAPASWNKITIYQLLTHTSGIADDAAKYEPGAPDKLVFNDKPLNFQPGEQWAYTNLGYIVLGYLLERISGQTYEDFIQENIFKPLGMNDSGLTSFVTIIRDVRLVIGRAAMGSRMRSVPIQGSDFRQALSIRQLRTCSDGKRDCSAAGYCRLRPCAK